MANAKATQTARTVAAYRVAARALYGISEAEAEAAIVAPEDDPGEWSPSSLAVIYFEMGDAMAEACAPHARHGLDECIRWGERAGIGYVEWINGAVAAVYPA